MAMTTVLPKRAWRDQLRTVRITIDGRTRDMVGASFRGVPFLVEDVERAGGRRVVVHEFPLRDDPFVEDLGRLKRSFTITGYVIGDDYLPAKDALLSALEDEEGPGQLLHPYYGLKSAVCQTYAVRETSKDGGIATFTLTFVEAPAQAPTPTVVVDSVGTVGLSADAARASTRAELVATFDPLGLPAFALVSAQTALTRATAGLSAKLAPVIGLTQELAAFAGQIHVLTLEAASLARQPGAAIDSFGAAIETIAQTAIDSPGAVLAALSAAYLVDQGPPAATTTPTRQRERANQLALTGALRRVLAIEAARLLPSAPYASIEDATLARDQVAGQLEEQAADAGDTAYPGLVTLRSDILRSVPSAAVSSRILTVTRRVSTPSLLLAYQLYGSVDKEADVIARNRIRHPGFIVGDLKVLSAG